MVPLGLNATVAGPNFKLASAELPSLWDGTDIGAVAGPGSDSYASGDFTLTSQGNDVYGISDAVHYVYQSVSGNFTITAQVSDFGAADQWAKAGLMVRPDLYAKSANVFIAQTYRHGAQLLTRTKAGAHTQVTANPATSEPWLKLVRRGNTFTAYASADDIHWQFLGQSVVTLPKTVDVGLALTARNPSLASTAVFSEVQITG
jgi:regulation of enolase protein 1 (concanavalin A-like superfamily)